MAHQATEPAATPRTLFGEVRLTFRSFQHTNFRLYFLGYFPSLCGTWMQNLALSWLVYKLTNSAFILGVVEFANLSPVLLLGLLGGWVADHYDRRKILLITQVLLMLQACALTALVLTNQIQVWQIIALAAFSGVVIAFEIPARQSLIVNIVDKEHVVNAISLNSSMFNGTRVIGPAIAAALISRTGEGFCFAVNAVSYLAALIALFFIAIPPRDSDSNKTKGGLMQGLTYAMQTPEASRILRLAALLSLFGAQFSLLMPVVAKEVLHYDVEGFGALKAAAALGSLSAGLWLANRGSSEMLTRGVAFAGLAFGVALIGFALATNFCLFLGFCMTFQLSGSHSLLQLNVPDQLRGRVMSVWTLSVLGMAPLGSLMMGWLAEHYGAPFALLLASLVAIVSAEVYLLLKK
jgi:MFS family permease